MKQTFLFILIVHFTFCILNSNAQATTDNTLHELNLKGKVKSVREICYKAVQKDNAVVKGKRETENKDEKDSYIVLDEKGNKTEETEYYSDGSLFRKLMYQYDDHGNVIKEERYGADGNLSFKRGITYKYDDKGKMTEKVWLKADGSPESKATWKHDEKGNAILYEMFDAAGKQTGKETYDAMGNLSEATFYKPNGSIDWKTTYKYDAQGNEIEQEEYEGTKFIIKYLKKYDDKGNQTQIDWCKQDGKVYRTYYMKYDFDKNGNWIRQTQFLKDKPTYMYEREVQYY